MRYGYEMWIVQVYMAWLNDDENWWGICEIVELSRADSSSSGHMRKSWIEKWVSWVGHIATQWMKCEKVRMWELGLSWVDSPSMWPLVRNTYVRWFRPETKLLCVVKEWVLVLCNGMWCYFILLLYLWISLHGKCL